MKPKFIPCVTSKHKSDFEVHLMSPSIKNELRKAKTQTIVDCFTYGLKRNYRRINPHKHYEWYVDLVNDLQTEDDLVFVAPDWDWLKEDFCYLNKLWEKKIHNAKCLIVPETYLFDKVEHVVGYAIKAGQNKTHPEWTHSFSQFYTDRLDGPTKLWTYDSGLINEQTLQECYSPSV